MPALENESTLAVPNNTFATKSVFGNDVDAVLGSLDTAQYPDAAHPLNADPVITPGDPGDEWTITDQLGGQFFRIEAEPSDDLVLQQRDANGNWIGVASSSPLEGTANGDGPGAYANAMSLRVGVAGDGFQGGHTRDFTYDLFAEAPDADHLAFTGQTPGHAFFAEITSADFDPLLGWFDDDGQRINSDDGGPGSTARIIGVVPDSGEVNLAVTGAGDADFNGNHAENGNYELAFSTSAAFFPIVLENAPSGTFVGVAGGVSRRPAEYALTDDADGRFDIDPLTGLITVEDGSKIDYESAAAHQVEVTTTFLNGVTDPIVDTVTIFVRDINEAPTAIAVDGATVAENDPGATVGAVTTEDQDIGDSHVYQSSDLRFEVVGGQLKLKDGVALDHESEPSVVLSVTAIDAGGLSIEGSFTVVVADVNEAPAAVDDTAVTTENAAVTVDVLANDTDEDAGDGPAGFTLDSVAIASVSGLVGSGTGSVSIDGRQLRFDPGADFDELDEGATATVVVDYTMSDDDGASAAARAIVTVTGVNDAPVVADVSAAALEDGPVVTGAFLGADLDAGDDGTTLNYTITSVPSEGRVVGIDNEIFTFDPGADFQDLGDGETREVTFRYIATDSAGAASDSATVTVTVTGVNDAPILDVNAGKTVDEGSAGVLRIAQLSASDPDDTDAEIVYTVTTAPANGRLAFAGDQGVAITQFTQEDLAQDRVVYVHDGGETVSDSFLFDVNDPDGSGPTSQSFAITVIPVNDPPALAVNALVIQEGETKLIGPESLRASDPDTDPEDLTFTIGVLTGGRFERVFEPGVAITQFTQADIDSAFIQFVHDGGEQPPAYTVTLGDGQETVGPFAADITFEGLNDAPVVEDVVVAAVEDGAAVTEAFAGDDVDADDDPTTLTYAITSAPGEGTVSNNADGTFTFDPGADFQDLAVGETRDVVFTYTATDSQGAVSNVGTVTVTVSGVNDAPLAGDVTLSAVEDGAAVTGSFAGSDIDSDDDATTLTYVLASAPSEGTVVDIDNDTFTFDPGTDFQDLAEGETREVVFTYTATDRHGAVSDGATVTVTVTGVNDAPMDLSLSNNRVGENAPAGTIVGTFWATDPDTEDGFLYELTDDAGGAFDVDPVTGRLTVGNPGGLDFEDPDFEGLYSIEISVTDPGGETYTERMDIVLTDFNEAPTAIEVAGGDVLPNAANGTAVATLSTIDPDTEAWTPSPESFTYALLDNARGRFGLAGDEIVVADGTRIEQGEAYELLVRSTDKGGLSVDQVVTISADPPPPDLAAVLALDDFDPGDLFA